MAAKKRSKTSSKSKKATKETAKVKKSTSIFEYLRFGESYTSLVLGVIAVVIVTILLLTFFSYRQGTKPGQEAIPTVVDVKSLNITITPTPGPTESPVAGKNYVVATGDSLWQIAEKVYGNGYNWVDIAVANHLIDPNQIVAGFKLFLPYVNLKDATVSTGEDEASVSRTVRIIEQTYTVVEGDSLWNIAVRSYGDGYQWVKIAKVNNLANPDLIYPESVLKIPR